MNEVTIKPEKLELRDEGLDGYRHYLVGLPVNAGRMLELLTDDGWVRGRYEWNFEPQAQPQLYTDKTVLCLSADSLLRWPSV